MTKRIHYFERQIRYWTRLRDRELMRLGASDAKEIEKERSKGKDKENNNHHDRARARIPSVDEIAAECKRIGSNIDPKYFRNYYTANHKGWPKDWKAALAVWTDNGKPGGRVKAESVADAPPVRRVYGLSDWCLCSERCANFRGGKCSRGITVPPDKDPERQTPPEECRGFTALESTKEAGR